MSRIMPVERRCAVCKRNSEQMVLSSSNSFGYSDLDYRPAEMLRSTMKSWLEECPHCCYVSDDISERVNVKKSWLSDTRFQTCDGIDFKSELAEKFYRYYLLNLKLDNAEESFWAMHCVVWVCDDAEDADNAAFCRISAIIELQKLLKADPNNERFIVTKADLLRRAGCFNELIDEFSTVKLKDETLNKALIFQVEKAKEKDTRRYTFEAVL